MFTCFPTPPNPRSTCRNTISNHDSIFFGTRGRENSHASKGEGRKTAVVSSDVLLLIIRFPFDGERDATLPPQIIASTKKDNDKENGTGTRLLSVIERPSSRDSWMLALIATRRSSTECLDQQLPPPSPLLVTTIYGLTSSHFSNFAHQCSSRDSSLPTPLSR